MPEIFREIVAARNAQNFQQLWQLEMPETLNWWQLEMPETLNWWQQNAQPLYSYLQHREDLRND